MCIMEKVFINPYHSSSLLHSISKLWKEEKFFDAKIEIGKHVFKVHKLVLVASSPRFLQVAENLTQDGRLDVQLPSDTDLNSMKLFITYLYEGVIKLSNSNLKFIEKIAALFQVTKLLQFCEEFKIHVQREEHNAKKRKLSKPIICQCPSCMSDNSESGKPCDSARVMERLRHKINVHSKKETVVIDSDGDHSSVDECISQIKKSLVKEGLSPLAHDVRSSVGQKVVQSSSKQRRSSRVPKRKQFSEDFCDNLDAPLFVEKNVEEEEEEDSDNHSSDETVDDIYNPSDEDADDFEEEISNVKTKKTYPNLKKMRQVMSGEVEQSSQQNKLKVSSDILKGNALRIESAAAGQSSLSTLRRENLTKFKEQGELDCSTKEQQKEIKIEPLSSSLDQSASVHSSSQNDKPALMSLLTGPPLLKPRDATIKEPFTAFKYGPQACEIPPEVVKSSTKPNISDDKEICQDSEPNQDNENVEDFVVRKVKEEPLDSVSDSNENAEPVIYSASQTGLKPISTSDNFCSGREAVYRVVHENDGGHVHAQMMEHSRRLDLDNDSFSDNKRTSIKSEPISNQENRDIQVSEMFSPKPTVSPIKPRQQISHSEPHPVTLITAAGQKFDLLSMRQQDMAKTQKAKYFFQGDPKLRRLEQRRIYSRQHRAKRNASKIRYKCIECHKLFKEKVHVKIHMRTHNGYKPYICQVCDHRSGTKDNLKRHVILRHKEVNVHELNFDVETIDSIQDTPMEVVHIGVEGDSSYSLKRQRDPEALCQECGKYFTSKYVLKKHITNIHGQARPYLCPFCNTKTYKIENLKTHITLTHKVNLASLDSYFKEIGPKRGGSRRKRDGKKSDKEGSESWDH